jgi:hypothetical protein
MKGVSKMIYKNFFFLFSVYSNKHHEKKSTAELNLKAVTTVKGRTV